MSDPRAEWPKVIEVCPTSGKPGPWACSCTFHGRPVHCKPERVEVVPASVAEELAEALERVEAVAAREDKILPIIDTALTKWRSLVGDKQKEEN